MERKAPEVVEGQQLGVGDVEQLEVRLQELPLDVVQGHRPVQDAAAGAVPRPQDPCVCPTSLGPLRGRPCPDPSGEEGCVRKVLRLIPLRTD